MSIPLPESLFPLLRCPCDQGRLDRSPGGETVECRSCGGRFPVRDGVPVLLNPANSLFRPERLILDHNPAETASALKKLALAVTPRIDLNVSAEQNCGRLRDLLLRQSANPAVLVVGSGDTGRGLRKLLAESRITLIETDVYFGTRVSVVADAHDLPFAAGTFDGVVCQAVLEHVLDPYRCVDEIHRVLKPDGVVYAETPFMQQVHAGPYDFTRFSLLGHRRLFRRFRQESAGVMCGPGMALTWAAWHFLRSFSPSPLWAKATRTLTACILFWLKYFDRWLSQRPCASDAASGVYFLGTKSGTILEDADLLQLHWSCQTRTAAPS